MKLWTLDDLGDLSGQRVFVRVDFNVPLDDGVVGDPTRIVEALPTIRELVAAGARVVLASHCGRPKATRNLKYSLAPVAKALAEHLGSPVAFADDCVGPAVEALVADLAPGAVLLLENLRFHAGEEANDPEFAVALAALADAYVDDAFGAAHRAHASTVGVAEIVPQRAAGRLLVREVEALSRLLGGAPRPFAALVGGAKIEGKIDTLENLLGHLDRLLVGGGMANTFLAAQGHELGGSLVERGRLDLAREILDRAKRTGVEVVLPVDLVTTDSLSNPTVVETVLASAGVASDRMAVDIGPATTALFAAKLADAETVFWNGPMGVFEQPPFDAGTMAAGRAVAAAAGFTVIGGGETVAAARLAGVLERIGHVSTGGGAALELLAGQVLPGVAVLAR
jgi:phosphoglycerate kinase